MNRTITIAGDITASKIFGGFWGIRGLLVLGVLGIATYISIGIASEGAHGPAWFGVPYLAQWTGISRVQLKVEALTRVWIISAFLVTLIVTVFDSFGLFRNQRKLPSWNGRSTDKPKKLDTFDCLLGITNALFLVITALVVVSLVLLYLFSDGRTLKRFVIIQIGMVGIILLYDLLLRQAYLLVPNVFTAEQRADDGVRDVEFELSKSVITLFLIDLPIVVGVAITAGVKAVLEAGSIDFALGIATGAVALHVVAGNLMSLILNGILRKDAEAADAPSPDILSRVWSAVKKRVFDQMKTRLIAIAVVVAALAAVAIYSFHGGSAQPVRMSVGIVTWGGNGQAFIARDKGYWPNLAVDVKILDDAKIREASFASGDLDIMISSVDLFAQEASSGIVGKIMQVTDVSNGGDGIIARTNIKTIKDLHGKKVALTLGSPSEYLLQTALKAAGMSVGDFKTVNADDPGKAGELFLSGSVDAAVTWEPFLSQATKGGGHILATSKDYPDIIVDLLIAGPRLTGDQRLMTEFLDGWMKATKFMEDHPDEATGIIAKGFGIKPEDVQGMLAGIKLGTSDLNKRFFAGGKPADSPLAHMFDDATSYWESSGRLKKKQVGADRVLPAAQQYFSH